MIHDTSTLPDSPQELKQIIVDLQRRYERENELLREQVRLLYARIFGKKSEKGQIDSTAIQLPLFDMPEPEAEPEKKEVAVPAHTRQKAGRKKLPDNLPRVQNILRVKRQLDAAHHRNRITMFLNKKIHLAITNTVLAGTGSFHCQCPGDHSVIEAAGF